MSTKQPFDLNAIMEYAVVIETLIDQSAWDAIEELIRELPQETRLSLLLKLRGLTNLAANILPRFEGEIPKA